MKDSRDVYRRQTGLFAMVSTGVCWVAVTMLALANQASFFSLEEYLRSPMWTEQTPTIVRIPLTVSAILLGLSNWILLINAVVCLILLASRFKTEVLSKVVVTTLIAISANIILYQALATSGYLLARHALPHGFARATQFFAIAAGITVALAFGVWWSGRRLFRISATTKGKNIVD
jgi:hypothetical protein